MNRARPASRKALDLALRSWGGLIENLPVGVYCCDRSGVVTHYNRRAAELWGRSPPAGDPDARFCGATAAFRPDGASLPEGETPMAQVLASGRPARDCEVLIERPDASRIHVLANLDPLFDVSGELIGAVSCFQDISALKQAEAQVRESERRSRELLDALPAAVYTTDAEGVITYYNEAAAEMAGRRPTLGEDKWCVTWKLFQADGEPLAHDQCPMAVALKENRPVRGVEAVAERPDGTRAPFQPYPTPLRDQAGHLVGAINMLVDISERKAAEARQRLLIDELNHRVNNTLVSIQSIARHTLRETASLDGFDAVFEARLMALSRAHDLLTRSAWQGADLRSVIEASLAPFAAEGRADIAVDDLELEPRVTLALSMILHELAANAARHGALSEPSGRLAVTAHRLDKSPRLMIDWVECGGPAAPASLTPGFGLQLVQRSIAADLQGEADVSFHPDGVRWAMSFPAPVQSPRKLH